MPAESAAVHSAHTHSTHTSNLLLTHHTFTAFICRNTFSSHKPSQTSSVKSAWTPQTCASFQLLQVPVWIVNNQQQIHTNSAHHHHHLPLTTRVVGAPQMILQPVSSIFPLFSTALWDLANSRPVHSLMLSTNLFPCLPRLLPPFTVPCKMILARLDEQETCPYHRCVVSCSSTSFPWLVFFFGALL